MEFYFTDPYRAMADYNEKAASDPSGTFIPTGNETQNASAGMERRA